MHTAYHRREVRREHESFGDAVLKPGDGLPDFGQVAVSGCAVGFEVVAGFAQQRTDIAFPARAGHAGFAVGNQRHTGLQTALPQQRHERQGYAGRVAAGVGDEARLCDGFAVEFAQSVHGLGNEAGGGVGHAVPVFPGRNVPYAEVGGKVDDAHALFNQARRVFHGDAVGRGEEDDVALFQTCLVGRLEGEAVHAAQTWKVIGNCGSRFAAAGYGGDFDIWMGGKQAQQFHARVARRADNAGFDFLLMVFPLCGWRVCRPNAVRRLVRRGFDWRRKDGTQSV